MSQIINRLITDSAVTTAKISSGAVTAAKLAAGSVGNIAVAAGIDAVKLADGSISNTEIQYLNGVTSAIQTQLDGKMSTGTAAFTSKILTTNDGGGAASGGSSGIEVEENGSATAYISTSSDRNSWKLKAPNTNGIITATPGASDSNMVLDSATQTLSGKTISGASNTLSDIARTSIATGTANHVLINDGSGNVSSEATLAISRGGTGQSSAGNAFNALAPATATGGLIVGSGTNTYTNVAVGSAGQIPVANSNQTNGVAFETIDSANYAQNYSLTATVAANAMTITLNNAAGNTPSTTDPVRVGFRNATNATGTYAQVLATAATTITIPSSATLGQLSSVAEEIYVYVINNTGTVELAVSTSSTHDAGAITNTTAISAASTSRTAIYSTSARTGVALRLIGKINSTQSTAGLWAASPTIISLVPFATGTLSSNNSLQMRIECAKITYSGGTPTIAYQSGSFISSLTDTGTGQIGVNLTAGFFSVAPVVIGASAEDAASGSSVMITATTATLVSVRVRDLAGTLVDESIWLVFIGVR